MKKCKSNFWYCNFGEVGTMGGKTLSMPSTHTRHIKMSES